MTAFAVNAAVAVDNARLFTMTDQALASRLDELSTLQEIDRQLNTSLDIRRVMELTLDWGLRVIDAKAGSIALINRDDNTLVLMATRNYTYVPQSLPLDKGLAGHVARTGQPMLVNDVSQDRRYIAGCPDTQSQMSVPIKRENEVIGVINLESPRKDAFSILHLDTASRLADHAAIAITNAQLYEQVKHANDAKGRFVSDVAHELAQPVTSIKGWIDMLVKGMAGPVNDMQKQFLGTVQFNAERMSTLIKDLLDIGRIETGRLKMEISPVAIKPIIEETIRSLQSQIDERQMTVQIRGTRRSACRSGRSRTPDSDSHQSGQQCLQVHAGRRQHDDHGRTAKRHSAAQRAARQLDTHGPAAGQAEPGRLSVLCGEGYWLWHCARGSGEALHAILPLAKPGCARAAGHRPGLVDYQELDRTAGRRHLGGERVGQGQHLLLQHAHYRKWRARATGLSDIIELSTLEKRAAGHVARFHFEPTLPIAAHTSACAGS